MKTPGPRLYPGVHVHVFIWVSSSSMPGFLLLRCSCGETRGTRRITK